MTIKVVRMSISVSPCQRKKLDDCVSQTGMNFTQIFGMMIDRLRIKDAIADKRGVKDEPPETHDDSGSLRDKPTTPPVESEGINSGEVE